MNPNQLLDSGAQQLGFALDPQQQKSLLDFVELLKKWNKTYNLTAIENTEEIITKHILDSLSVSEHLVGKQILDIGSGAGLPGIPLAIMHADKHFTLLDSNIKKIRFMQQAVIELKLNNVDVVHSRIEEFKTDINHIFNTVVSRAFTDAQSFLSKCEHVLTQSRLIFMLGKQKQLEALPKSYNVEEIFSVNIPQLEAQRHIAIVEKKL